MPVNFSKTNSQPHVKNHVIDKISDFDMSTQKKGVTKKSTHQNAFKPKYPMKKKYNPKFEPKSATGPERKAFDVNSTVTAPIGSAFNTTGQLLNQVSQSSAARVGNKIRIMKLHFRANILWQGGQTTNSPSQIRFVIVWDKQANQAAAVRGDVFTDGTTMMSAKNIINEERFVTLVDEVSEQIQSNGQFCVSFERFVKMNMEAVFNGSGTTPTTGSILLFVAANSDASDATSAHFPAVQYYSRIRYTDI